jgi:hypothetical protein
MGQFEYLGSALKGHALALLVATLCSAAALWASHTYKVDRESRLLQARSGLSAIRDQYRQAVEADDILRTSQQQYRQLQKRSFIGDEPRLLWIEALRSAGHAHHVYSLHYNLNQRQPLQLAGFENPEHFQLYVSSMHLDMELAHEVDLLRYFAALEQNEPGLYRVRGCTLSTLFTAGEVFLDKANIKASCDMAWYTVKSASAAVEDGETL